MLPMYEVSQGMVAVCQVDALHAGAYGHPECEKIWGVLYYDVRPALKYARSAPHGPMGVSHVPQGDPVASVPESIGPWLRIQRAGALVGVHSLPRSSVAASMIALMKSAFESV